MKTILLVILATGLFLTFSVALSQLQYEPVSLFRFNGDADGHGLRPQIHPVGDQNQDGFDDFIAGASGRGGGALLFYGGSPIDTIPDRIYYSSWVYPLGDINGDGIIDLFTGSYFGQYGIIWGGSLDTILTVELPQLGNGTNYFYCIGDVNDDGCGDLMGLSPNNVNQIDIGRLTIWSGGDEIDTVIKEFVGDTLRGRISYNGSGDINGDGALDMLITYNGLDGGLEGSSELILYSGYLQDDIDEIDYTVHLPFDDFAIYETKIIPDITGDGLDEIGIRMNRRNGFYPKFYIIEGSEDFDTEQDHEFPDFVVQEGRFDNIGDVNADGYADFGVAAGDGFGALFSLIYLGGPDFDNIPEAEISGSIDGLGYSGLGFDIEPGGDVNGNGVDDMLVLAIGGREEFAFVVALDEEFAQNSAESQQITPNQFTFHPLFPDPFNSSIKIRFDLMSQSNVAINVFSVKGCRLGCINSGFYGAGSHELAWDGKLNQIEDISSGVYFFQIATENGVQTRKAVFIR